MPALIYFEAVYMEITVLMDNNTYIDKYYLGEPAVSYYIEDGDRRLLFDTGYSDAFIKNAEVMGVDPTELTDIAISHGHNDHTGGLKYLLAERFKTVPNFIAHPDVFLKRTDNGLDIGCPVSRQEVEEKMNLRLTKTPVQISKNIVFLGEIPPEHEKRYSIGTAEKDGKTFGDFIFDDSALAVKGKDGIYIITGCSHSGICNITDYAKKVMGDGRIIGILGGFHLFENDERTLKTVSFLEKEGIREMYPCHCTSFKVKSFMDKHMDIKEVGVGLRLKW